MVSEYSFLTAFCCITRTVSWTNQPESEEEGKISGNNGVVAGGLPLVLVITGGRAEGVEGKHNHSRYTYRFPR